MSSPLTPVLSNWLDGFQCLCRQDLDLRVKALETKVVVSDLILRINFYRYNMGLWCKEGSPLRTSL